MITPPSFFHAMVKNGVSSIGNAHPSITLLYDCDGEQNADTLPVYFSADEISTTLPASWLPNNAAKSPAPASEAASSSNNTITLRLVLVVMTKQKPSL